MVMVLDQDEVKDFSFQQACKNGTHLTPFLPTVLFLQIVKTTENLFPKNEKNSGFLSFVFLRGYKKNQVARSKFVASKNSTSF